MGTIDIFFSGFGSAVLAGGVTYYIYKKSQKPPSGRAYEILKKLGKMLKEPEGEYAFGRSSEDNYKIAKLVYREADGDTISTSFLEDPSNYGDGDLAKLLKTNGKYFKRITCEEVCNSESEKRCRENMQKIKPDSKLIVIPEGDVFTRLDGMFCRLDDGTYLSFISFRNPKKPTENEAVIFRDGIAKEFFDYYKGIADKYSE